MRYEITNFQVSIKGLGYHLATDYFFVADCSSYGELTWVVDMDTIFLVNLISSSNTKFMTK